ncbi:uncharacterized protein VTP21DRAFT_3479 [Calcarisporiella thermophila]|uniref:uncharacterized protein n=1 Tax=Calcarisporiella thermophila TaxID=911321 RepID=UPI003741F38E
MAQGSGTLKKKPSKQPEKKVLSQKKGGKIVASKKSDVQKQRSRQKKFSAAINNKIETIMASRAAATGKLTIMKSIAKPIEKNKGANSKK